MKKCYVCKIEQIESEFYKNKSRKDGLDPKCKNCRRKSNEKYYLNNAEGFLERNKAWREDNPDYQNQYQKERLNIDPIFKLVRNLRRRLNHALKGFNKSKNTVELIGRTSSKLMDYFEPMFYANMTRENYGKVWHVDHIKPCSSFDLSKPEEQRKCFHYSNLQPLLAIDNLKKGGRIEGIIR